MKIGQITFYTADLLTFSKPRLWVGELMIVRAAPFLAGRSLTALIAVAMVTAGFAGLFIVGKTATASGDLIVTDTATYVIRDLQQFVDGNVIVDSGGTLEIIDGTLSVISNYDQKYTITVGSRYAHT